MLVAAGFAAPFNPNDVGRYQPIGALRRRFIANGYARLSKLASASGCVAIPTGEALIIIGGRRSIYSELSLLINSRLKFVAQSGRGLTITASSVGSKLGNSVRFLGHASSIGASAAFAPTGIAAGYMAATKGGAISTRYVDLLKRSKDIFTSPSMVARGAKEASSTLTIIQLIGDGAGRPDRIAGSGAVDLYINNLFNLLLQNGTIERGVEEDEEPDAEFADYDGAISF